MPLVASILWRRLDAPGHDACRLERRGLRWLVSGAAAFRHATGPASVEYSLLVDRDWRTSQGRVKGAIGERAIDIRISREENGWRLNRRARRRLSPSRRSRFRLHAGDELHPVETRRRCPPALRCGFPSPGSISSWPACQSWNRSTNAAAKANSCMPRRRSTTGPCSELDASGFIRRYPGLWEFVPE